MSKKHNRRNLNSSEKQIAEFDEWQKNSYNPGYFIGSGKVPLPLKNSLKTPVILIIIGMSLGIITIYNLIGSFNIQTIIQNIIPLLISSILIIGGIMRLAKKTR